MAGRDSDTNPELETDDWISDPSQTVPGVSMGDVWGDEADILGRLIPREDDWNKALPPRSRPEDARPRCWDKDSGAWRAEEVVQVADPSAIAADLQPATPVVPERFDFGELGGDDVPESAETPPPGWFSWLRRLVGR